MEYPYSSSHFKNSNEHNNFSAENSSPKWDSLGKIVSYLSGLLSQESPSEDHAGYEVFTSRQSREELYAIGKGISEYVHNNDIGTVLFVDRSARPGYVALNEYWAHAYPDDKKPAIRFINPKGCVSQEDIGRGMADITSLMINDQLKQYEIESPANIRPEEEIVADIENMLSRTNSDNKPILVFDACIHTGETLAPTILKLLRAGASDIRVGTVSTNEMDTHIPVDLAILADAPDRLCYPFGQDAMTQKGYGSVIAQPNSHPFDQEDARIIRKEIRKAVAEEWQFHHTEDTSTPENS